MIIASPHVLDKIEKKIPQEYSLFLQILENLAKFDHTLRRSLPD
jgi:hypothetical protein